MLCIHCLPHVYGDVSIRADMQSIDHLFNPCIWGVSYHLHSVVNQRSFTPCIWGCFVIIVRHRPDSVYPMYMGMFL